MKTSKVLWLAVATFLFSPALNAFRLVVLNECENLCPPYTRMTLEVTGLKDGKMKTWPCKIEETMDTCHQMQFIKGLSEEIADENECTLRFLERRGFSEEVFSVNIKKHESAKADYLILVVLPVDGKGYRIEKRCLGTDDYYVFMHMYSSVSNRWVWVYEEVAFVDDLFAKICEKISKEDCEPCEAEVQLEKLQKKYRRIAETISRRPVDDFMWTYRYPKGADGLLCFSKGRTEKINSIDRCKDKAIVSDLVSICHLLPFSEVSMKFYLLGMEERLDLIQAMLQELEEKRKGEETAKDIQEVKEIKEDIEKIKQEMKEEKSE